MHRPTKLWHADDEFDGTPKRVLAKDCGLRKNFPRTESVI
jgi:hypothetical protein